MVALKLRHVDAFDMALDFEEVPLSAADNNAELFLSERIPQDLSEGKEAAL